MKFEIGDSVTRKSYNNDIVFKIIAIDEEVYYLSGLNVRLCADALEEDLIKCDDIEEEEERAFINRIKDINNLERNDYFYLPGKILHIDGDKDYLKRCLQFYEDLNIWAIGVVEKEDNVAYRIRELLEEYNPSIVVITGHDAYYKKGNKDDITSYKNSMNFVKAVKEARRYEKSHDKLIIIAGACQSDYEELIKAGANFASSPKRINIHALDPAIIASKMSLSSVTEDIDLKQMLEKTKYGKDGMGGVKTKGTMYTGYPR
ncbi:MAG: sporulation peptidase YabG [Bacilli bacterium]